MESNSNMNLRSQSRQLRKRKWKSSSNVSESVKASPSNFKSKVKKLNDKTNKSEGDQSSQYKEETNLLNLPNEILNKIAMYLEVKEISCVAATCQRLNAIVSENLFWKRMFKKKFPTWDQLPHNVIHPGNWKRQFGVNHTKSISYQLLGSAQVRKLPISSKIFETASAYGFKKMCCSRDHVFALDMASGLHVFSSRWERHPLTSEQMYKKVEWHKEFARHVIDVTTDPRYDNNHRRYVYVLTQSENMRRMKNPPNTRSNNVQRNHPGWNKEGWPISGDKIDVFDERTCRRVFNMTFDPEMRFVSMKLTSITSQQKTLYILTDSGKVYSLHLYESSLLNLGSEGMQVTLKSASKNIGEKVCKIETSVGITGLITERGKLFVTVQRRSEFTDIFGREMVPRICIPHPIAHVAKVMSCSVGDRHLGFIDEYNRVFLLGNNRYGQLGTGDRMDRTSPVQVLYKSKVRLIHCGLNHTVAIVEVGDHCEMFGSGSGNNGRLPGKARGCNEFTQLSINVPWNVRQMDAHKESIFLLSCYDIDDQVAYKERTSLQEDHFLESLYFKSQNELLLELRKCKEMAKKMKIIEMMVSHVEQGIPRSSNNLLNENKKKDDNQENNTLVPCPSSSSSNTEDSPLPGANNLTWSQQQQAKDLRLLHNAIELMRLEAERVELDHKIKLSN